MCECREQIAAGYREKLTGNSTSEAESHEIPVKKPNVVPTGPVMRLYES